MVYKSAFLCDQENSNYERFLIMYWGPNISSYNEQKQPKTNADCKILLLWFCLVQQDRYSNWNRHLVTRTSALTRIRLLLFSMLNLHLRTTRTAKWTIKSRLSNWCMMNREQCFDSTTVYYLCIFHWDWKKYFNTEKKKNNTSHLNIMNFLSP